MRRFALILLLATASGGCPGSTDPGHRAFQGALKGGYYQRLFNGKQANELPGLSQVPVVQYKGTLCLFEGGDYSYGRDFWLYNTRANGGVDHDVVYGTYEGDLSTSLAFTGTLGGGASVAGDTINVGSNQFVRHSSYTATCESQR